MGNQKWISIKNMRCAIYALFLFVGSVMGLEDGLKQKEKDLTEKQSLDRGRRQAASVCSEFGWDTRGSSCYLVGGKKNATASEAKQFCTEKGGYLAEIESPEEQNQVAEFLGGDVNGKLYWIGLERDVQARKTIWQHSRHQLEWTNWHSGSQTYHYTGEHCFTMNVVGGKWGWSVHWLYECDKSEPYPDINIPTIALCEADV